MTRERGAHAKRWPASILTRKSMPDRAGLILSQIPHCTKQNSGQMPWGMGSFGFYWYIIVADLPNRASRWKEAGIYDTLFNELPYRKP